MSDEHYNELKDEIRELKALVLRFAGVAPEPRGPDDLLALEEAAAALRVSPETLRRGKAGTHVIPRHSSRPVMFRRFEIEKFVRERARKAREGKDVKKRLKLIRRGKDAPPSS